MRYAETGMRSERFAREDSHENTITKSMMSFFSQYNFYDSVSVKVALNLLVCNAWHTFLVQFKDIACLISHC